VSWATLNPLQSIVQWSSTKPSSYYSKDWSTLDGQINGTRFTFTVGGWKGSIHTATITGLQPNTMYWYRVGDPTAKNLYNTAMNIPELYFTTPPPNGGNTTSGTLKIAVYADMGATDASNPVISRLVELKELNKLDLILHNGDISYADGYESLNDRFMRKIEPIAAFVPYQTVPGNHEDFFQFVPYLNRFSIMPFEESNATSPMYYSFNYGLVHVVGINTEAYPGLIADISVGTAQHKWIDEDLTRANQNRDQVPYIIVMMHRPLYCTNTLHDCNGDAALLRDYLEDLFYKNKVDVVITGHVHAYERTFPVYHQKLDSTAPIYLLNGAGGDKEQLEGGWNQPQESWSANRFAIYGYGLLEITKTTLQWNFIAANNGSILDSFTLQKN